MRPSITAAMETPEFQYKAAEVKQGRLDDGCDAVAVRMLELETVKEEKDQVLMERRSDIVVVNLGVNFGSAHKAIWWRQYTQCFRRPIFTLNPVSRTCLPSLRHDIVPVSEAGFPSTIRKELLPIKTMQERLLMTSHMINMFRYTYSSPNVHFQLEMPMSPFIYRICTFFRGLVGACNMCMKLPSRVWMSIKPKLTSALPPAEDDEESGVIVEELL